MLSEQLPINKYVIRLRATLAQPEEKVLTPLAFYLSHPSAAAKKPLTSAARFAHFVSAGVGACAALLLRAAEEEESSGRFVEVLNCRHSRIMEMSRGK